MNRILKLPSQQKLLLAGLLTYFVAATHVIAIFVGPKMYEFLDAKEFADMSLQGSLIPPISTLFIAFIFFAFGTYALSGAKKIRPLPHLKTILNMVAWLFIIRGLFVILFITLGIMGSELFKLREVFFSLLSLFIGLLYYSGLTKGKT